MFGGIFGQTFNQESHNITNSHNTTTNNHYIYTDDSESQVLHWLSPLQPWDRHFDVSCSRAEGVGDWVVKTPEFEAWLRRKASDEAVNATLFCCGALGAGKPYIYSLVIDTLYDQAVGTNPAVSEPQSGEASPRPRVGIACLYSYYGNQREQTTIIMIGALLKQFVMDYQRYLTWCTKCSKQHRGEECSFPSSSHCCIRYF
ncbi:hypothetical protein L873DRAFT_400749 [Choiromyces venosus 120613-1]|uniref:Nephrocystin 3-like N-terminal domain-containing protein n=1 Tax=Choiromyces venosus 120613-1 TaxID=1336337 RepID=A0A3N4IXN1_9PEZI|nr:hypothetical protein L873DRAFT_400749 [Choiromyces venosus 120613-1]